MVTVCQPVAGGTGQAERPERERLAPPDSNTGVMKKEDTMDPIEKEMDLIQKSNLIKKSFVDIDQIRFVLPYRNEWIDLVEKVFQLEKIMGTPVEITPQNGYSLAYGYGFRETTGLISVMVNLKRKDMGILVNFPAKAKKSYEAVSDLLNLEVDWFQIIRTVYRDLHGHISRLDVNVDLLDFGYSPHSIAQRLQADQIVFTDSRKHVVKKESMRGIGDFVETQTIGVGSRSSNAYLRLYDKKKEQQAKRGPYLTLARKTKNWLRIEGEFKHKLAREIGLAIADSVGVTYRHLVSLLVTRWLLIEKDSGKLTPEWETLVALAKNLTIFSLRPSPSQISELVEKKLEWLLLGGPAGVFYLFWCGYGDQGLEKLLNFMRDYIKYSKKDGGYKPSPKLAKEIAGLKKMKKFPDLDKLLERWHQLLVDRDQDRRRVAYRVYE